MKSDMIISYRRILFEHNIQVDLNQNKFKYFLEQMNRIVKKKQEQDEHMDWNQKE